MSEAVQQTIIGGLFVFLGAVLVNIPAWLRAGSEQRKTKADIEVAARSAAETVSNATFSRLNDDLKRQVDRVASLELRVDALRAELAQERDTRAVERGQLSSELAEERRQRLDFIGKLDTANTEIIALRTHVVRLENTILDLKNTITELKGVIEREKDSRQSAEKRVAELETKVS